MSLRRTLQDRFQGGLSSVYGSRTRRIRPGIRGRRDNSVQSLEVRQVLTTIDLAALIAAQGTVVYGADPFDQSGFSVSNAGDVNRDGFEDFLIGSPFASGQGNVGLTFGEAFLVFGSSGLPSSLNLASPGSAGTMIYGIDSEDVAGWSVSGGGDINGDGFDDLIVGAVAADGVNNSRSGAGEAYVIFGKASMPATITLSSLGANGVTIFGANFSHSAGNSVSGAGDVNGDGCDDVLIGSDQADKSYIVFGSPSLPTTINLGSLGAAGVTMAPGDEHSVSSAGDVNGDGFDDVMMGAPEFSGGRTYVVYGSNSLPATLNLTALESSGFSLVGPDGGDFTGGSVSSAGDVNGDGFDDLLIGAAFADGVGNATTDSGQAYIVYGSVSLPSTVFLGSLGVAGVTIFGIDVDDNSGFSVSGAGDTNGDGFDDILIGAKFADASGNSKSDAGESYLIFGGSSLPVTLNLSSLGTNGITIFGANANDNSGRAVSSAGDVNGDGFDDLLIGAEGGDAAGNTKSAAGESYVLFGGDFSSAVTHPGTSVGETLTGNASANVMIGGRGNDVLLSNGGADVLRGGQGNDAFVLSDLLFRRIVGGTGFDTLRLDGSGFSLNLTTLANSRLSGIEEIDLTGSGDNTLTLNALEVLNLSSESNALVVRSNPGDIINIGSGWTPQAAEAIGPDRFRVYSQGLAILKLQDSTPPTSTIVVSDNSLFADETSLVTFTFSEAVTEFTNADLIVENGTLSNVATVDGGITWTATLTPTDNITDSTNVVTLNNAEITDTAGLPGTGTTDSNNYAVDTSRPTATILVTDNLLGLSETSLVTITFDEPVTGFSNADLTIANGSLSDVGTVDGGTTWTAVLTPLSGVSDSTNLITLNNSGVQNSLGNPGVGSTNSNNYAVDTVRPSLLVTVSPTVLTTVQTAIVTFAFSEAVTDFSNADVQVANAVMSAVATANAGVTWTATLTAASNTVDATNVISVDMTAISDVAGNAGAGTTVSHNYAVDSQLPTASISMADTSLKIGETSLVTITFSEAIVGLTSSDLVVSNGTISSPGSSNGGVTWTAVFTPSINTEDTTNVITLNNSGITDLPGNPGTGSTQSVNYEVLTRRPTATVVVADTTLIVGETSLVTVTFDGIVTGFTNADLTIPSGVLSNVSSADGGRTWTATLSPANNIFDATNVITLNLSGVSNTHGNPGSGTVVSGNYIVDTQRPTVSIVVADTLLTVGQTSSVTFSFSEAVTGFSNADIQMANGTLSNVVTTNGGITWTAVFTPTAGISDTTNLISVNNSGVSDTRGNTGSGLTSSNNYVIDTLRPTASIVVASTRLKAGQTSLVTFSFSEAVTGLTNADLQFSNGVLSPVSSANGGLTWTATFTPANGLSDSTNVIVLTNSGIFDAAGNAGVGTTASNNFLIETHLIQGTGSNDAFTLTYQSSSTGSVTIAVSSNGGPVRSLGAFPMSVQLSLDGLGGTDSVRISGTSGIDVFTISGTLTTVNGGRLTLGNVESRTLAGGAGNDTYRFDVDAVLGTYTLDEASGGTDTIDFALTTSVGLSLNLATATTQVVHPANLRISLGSSSTVENVFGGALNDTLTGNALSNVLNGNSGNDVLTGAGGSDTLIGGLGDDSYIFAAATASETDTLTEGSGGGTDTISFAAMTVPVTFSLATAAAQPVHVSRTIRLSSTVHFENVAGGTAGDNLTGNSAANLLNGNAGNDILNGAAGNDGLLGGPGDDLYVFTSASTAEADTVTEVVGGGVDTISFAAISTPVTFSLATAAIQQVHHNRTLRLSSTVHFENVAGGSGADSLTGNSVSNIMIGNAGNDILSGLAGRDLLIGGLGLDRLNGGDDEDILIAGRTANDALFSNLNFLQAEWTSARSYGFRIANLRSGVGSPAVSLKVKVNVLNDLGDDDVITSGNGTDWYLRALDDVITDLVVGEFTDFL